MTTLSGRVRELKWKNYLRRHFVQRENFTELFSDLNFISSRHRRYSRQQSKESSNINILNLLRCLQMLVAFQMRHQRAEKSWESWVGENCKFARPINVRFRSTLVDFHFQVKISLEISTRSLLNLKQEFSSSSTLLLFSSRLRLIKAKTQSCEKKTKTLEREEKKLINDNTEFLTLSSLRRRRRRSSIMLREARAAIEKCECVHKHKQAVAASEKGISGMLSGARVN